MKPESEPVSVPTESRPTAQQCDDPAISAWGKYNFFVCADKGQHDMRLAFIAGYKRALHDAQPQLCDPTDDAELAELLNMLMATNVHGAILQLRDHLDGDKRLLDNYQRLYKQAYAKEK